MINLPTYVKESVVLTDSEKKTLKNVERLPFEIEIDEIRLMPAIQELLNAFIGDETTRDLNLQLMAKEYLDEGNVDMAWKILLV